MATTPDSKMVAGLRFFGVAIRRTLSNGALLFDSLWQVLHCGYAIRAVPISTNTGRGE